VTLRRRLRLPQAACCPQPPAPAPLIPKAERHDKRYPPVGGRNAATRPNSTLSTTAGANASAVIVVVPLPLTSLGRGCSDQSPVAGRPPLLASPVHHSNVSATGLNGQWLQQALSRIKEAVTPGLASQGPNRHLEPRVVPPPLVSTSRWRTGPSPTPITPKPLKLLAKGLSRHAAIAKVLLTPASLTRECSSFPVEELPMTLASTAEGHPSHSILARMPS
jgi:hypothetical protein